MSTKASHKRQLSSSATPARATPGMRASKRIKDSGSNTPASATPKKSKYFEAADSDDESTEDATSDDGEASGYEDEEAEDEDDSPSDPPSESEDEDESEEAAKPKRRKGGKQAGSTPASMGKSSQLWREGVKAGLGPGKQVFIAKPKPRGDGGVKYVPGRIHPNSSKSKEPFRSLARSNDGSKKNGGTTWLSERFLFVMLVVSVLLRAFPPS